MLVNVIIALAWRGRGPALSDRRIAALSGPYPGTAQQLAAGRSFCFLYTDLANPTSNRIYVALGYERVCDSVEYAFR